MPESTHSVVGDPSDPKAFEILVREHHRRLIAYAISIIRDREAAKDLVQDAFVVAYQNLEKFDTTRDFGAWMRGIVRNKCREWGRSRKLVPLEEEVLEALENQHREWDAQGRETGRQTLFATLHQCIAKLPDLLAQAVQLFYLEEQSGAATAARLDADEPAVRKRLQRARQQLQACLQKSLASA